MKHALALALIAALVGCASVLPADPSRMTADQLKAAAKDKSAAIACSNGKTAAGNVTMLYVNLDQALRLGSTATVEPDCRTTITTTSAPSAAASAP